MVELKRRGPEAWDERFTHIDVEHFQKGKRVEEWFPMDKELPKGILDEEKGGGSEESEGEVGGGGPRGRGSDEEESGSDADGNDNEAVPLKNTKSENLQAKKTSKKGEKLPQSQRPSSSKPPVEPKKSGQSIKKPWYCVRIILSLHTYRSFALCLYGSFSCRKRCHSLLICKTSVYVL